MTKKEFQDLTGFNVLDEAFDRIHAMYMNAGDSIDKATFCKDFKKHADSVLLDRYYSQVEKQQAELDALRKEQVETARLLIREASQSNNDTLRNHAIKLLGASAYLREKIHLGIEFDQFDYELVTELL